MSRNAAKNAHNKGMHDTSLKTEESEKSTVWKRKADGVYLHVPSRFYYWRPWRIINGRWTRTWESLDTTSQKIAVERYAQLRYPSNGKAPTPSSGTPTVSGPIMMGQVIRRYIKDGYPDKHKAKRKGQTLDDETAHCETLLKFWDTIPVDDAGPGKCDKYQEHRKAQGFSGGRTGNRQVDRELNTLNNACRWGVRCEIIKSNPIADRPRYQPASAVKHCREFCPLTTDELHDAVRPLFSHPNSVVLGFQALTEAMTGLRGSEPLKWGTEIFGTMTEDRKNVHVWRVKGQHANQPYCVVHEGLSAVMTAHAAWKNVN